MIDESMGDWRRRTPDHSRIGVSGKPGAVRRLLWPPIHPRSERKSGDLNVPDAIAMSYLMQPRSLALLVEQEIQ